MESHKPLSSAAEPPKKSPLFLILAILSLVAAVAAAFYLGLQKSAIEEEQKRLTADITSLQDEITALEGQKIEAAQLARQWLDEVKKDEILWSRVITRIQSLLPVDPATQIPKIKVLSYSGSQAGKLILNAQTVEAQIEPYEYVAELISIFNGSSYFADAYVPAITRGETDQGNRFLSFVLNFSYRQGEEEKAAAATTTEETGATDESAKLKVPRQ